MGRDEPLRHTYASELGYQARQRNKGCGRPNSKLVKLGSRAVAVDSIEMMGKVGWVVTRLWHDNSSLKCPL